MKNNEIKKLKFAENLIPLVVSGEKTATWRLFDDKDLQPGDKLSFINQATGQEFAAAEIISVREKALGKITDADFVGHEKFASREDMFENYRSYYGDRVSWDSIVKMVNFKILLPAKNNYEKIGPTAWGVAYCRAQTDIKYAPEIFTELDAILQPANQAENEYRHLQRVRNSNIGPQFEARYKLINRLLGENKTGQILEIAAGLAPRGLMMTEADSSLTYVEVDVPAMAELKRDIIKKMIAKKEVAPAQNLYVEGGDALDLDSLLAAARHFKNEPVAIINEGLLRYLDFKQRAVVAKNIHALLEKFGGVWITSDITLARVLAQSEEMQINNDLIKKFSGIDVNANKFANEAEAVKFFEGFGFTIERHGFNETLGELVSPARIGMSEEQVKELLGWAVVFVMRVAK